jgi:hypothetical protein
MTGLLRQLTGLFRYTDEPRHDKARDDEPEQARQQSLPIVPKDKIEPGHNNARPQQQAAEEPKRGMSGRNTLTNRPQKGAEKKCSQQNPRYQSEHQT